MHIHCYNKGNKDIKYLLEGYDTKVINGKETAVRKNWDILYRATPKILLGNTVVRNFIKYLNGICVDMMLSVRELRLYNDFLADRDTEIND